ncbi:YlbF family regulator [Peptococcaceae bacterium]|nr:YlbF family regulator [Peptococcaceae bacterium]
MYKELEKKAEELGKLITQTEEFKEVKAKQAKLFENQEALNLFQEFNRLQRENDIKKEEGSLTDEDSKKTEQLELKMLDYPIIKEFLEAQTKLQKILNLVMQTVIKTSTKGSR